MRRLVTIALALAALVLVACGDDEETTTAEETTGSEQPAAAEPDQGGSDKPAKPDSDEQAKPGIEITVGESQFGEVLFDEDQRTVYYFDKEAGSESECYGACAEAWPPVLTDGEPQAGGGAESGLLGTTERDDGSTQVTYDGRPLYYYHDEPAGQVLCHNVNEFGGLWLAVQPSGAAVS